MQHLTLKLNAVSIRTASFFVFFLFAYLGECMDVGMTS